MCRWRLPLPHAVDDAERLPDPVADVWRVAVDNAEHGVNSVGDGDSCCDDHRLALAWSVNFVVGVVLVVARAVAVSDRYLVAFARRVCKPYGIADDVVRGRRVPLPHAVDDAERLPDPVADVWRVAVDNAEHGVNCVCGGDEV